MTENNNTSHSTDTKTPELSLVLPCYNEEDSLRTTVIWLVRAFSQIESEWELVLVDNGSRDATGEVIDDLISEGYPVVKQTVEVNQGYGNGILEGLKVTRGKIVGFTCADAQIDATDVAKLAEVALNARRPKLFKVRRRFRTEGMLRRIVSMTYNTSTRMLFGSLGTGDVNANPKFMPREYYERMNLQAKDWFLDPEIMIKSKSMGLDVFEMNVFAQMRMEGASNVKPTTVWEFISNLLKYRFSKSGDFLRERPSLPAGESAKPARDAQMESSPADSPKIKVTSNNK